MIENLDPVSSKHSEELALAVERARKRSFKLTINTDMVVAIVNCMLLQGRNGIVTFYVDENLRILDCFVQTATSHIQGTIPVHTMSMETLKKVRGRITCLRHGSDVQIAVTGALKIRLSEPSDALDAGKKT